MQPKYEDALKRLADGARFALACSDASYTSRDEDAIEADVELVREAMESEFTQ